MSSDTEPRNLGGTYLLSAGCDIQVPFRLELESAGTRSELLCSEVVRVLVGKRLVCFGTWKGDEVVAKLFLHPSSSSRHCDRETRGVEALAAAGVATSTLLGRATVAGSHVEVLLFERLHNAVDLMHSWESACSESERKALLGKALLVLAAQHQAGLKHTDPHMKNFLLSAGEVYTVDGAAVDTRRRGKPLSRRISLDDVGFFFSQFYPRYDRLIADFHRDYAKRRGWSLEEADVRRVKKATILHRKRRRTRSLRRIYRDCTAFACRSGWRERVVYDRSASSEPLKTLLRDPEVSMARGRPLEDGDASTVSLVEAAGRHLAVKQYKAGSWRRGLERTVRQSPASAAWRNAQLLLMLGIPISRPIAFVENRWGPLRRDSYYVSEYVDGVRAGEYFSDTGQVGEREAEAARRVVEVLEELAANRLSHSALETSSFVVGELEVWLADIDALKPVRSEKRFRRLFTLELERFCSSWSQGSEVGALFGRLLEPLLERLHGLQS